MTFHSLNLISFQDHFSCRRAGAGQARACRCWAWLSAPSLVLPYLKQDAG
jgi:hypothetical protein